MRFFLDFEATRFSNRIISIGCVAENGATFYTLVKPGDKKKVDNFITQLTGITNDMLAAAPSADKAFNMLMNYIEKNNDHDAPEYYCYGDSDFTFLEYTLKRMEDTRACICAQAIRGNMIDYAQTVKKFFMSINDMSLRKVYMLIQDTTELYQRHDALEDALMLKCVFENLTIKCRPEDRETILALPSQNKPVILNKKKAPELFIYWDQFPKWEAKTKANIDSWVFKCTDQHSGHTMYFESAEVAALWVIKYITRVSPKDNGNIKKVINNINNALTTGKCRYNCIWEYSPEGAIAIAAKEEK
jgi:DNA polymerase III epsilon subunit-like protein